MDEKTSASIQLAQEEKQVLYKTVRALHSAFDLSDDVPQIQSSLSTLELEISSYVNPVSYVDQLGFQTSLGGMMQHLALLESLIEQGKGFVYLVYTHRSASKALPQFWIGKAKETGPGSTAKKDKGGNKDDDEDAQTTRELRAKKVELTKKQIEILRPEMTKFKDLVAYVTLVCDSVRECLQALVEMKDKAEPMHMRMHDAPGAPYASSAPATAAATGGAKGGVQQTVPEVVYDALLRLLDVVVRLSELKGDPVKQSIAADCARYKDLKIELEEPDYEPEATASSNKQKDRGGGRRREDDFEDQLLRGFLDRNIFTTFRTEVKKVRDHDRLLAGVLRHAIERLNGEVFVTPEDKFGLIRSVPHLLLMIDGSTRFDNFPYVGGLKPIQKVFKRFPLVPLFADQTLVLAKVLERSKNFPSAEQGVKSSADAEVRRKWGADMRRLRHEVPGLKQKFKDAYKIELPWPAMRQTYELFLSRLSLMMNRLQRAPFLKELNEANVDTAREVFELAREGLCHLSSWSTLLQMFLAWKYTNPCSESRLTELRGQAYMDEPGRQYEQCIRYNLSLEEQSIFVDVVSMIKGLEGQMRAAESTIAPIIRFHLHHCIQQLAQGDLQPILHRVDKRKRDAISLLLQIRSVAADWVDGLEPREDYKLYKRNKGQVHAQHPARVVSASATQLQLLRVLVRSLYDDASPYTTASTGMFGRADLERHDVKKLKEFYEDSFYYPHLLNFAPTLKATSELSFLWFREFWLGKLSCIQFEIEKSLPWILTGHVIANRVTAPAMLQSMLYTLDVYNDAAHAALHVLQQQHLYDEIEAEASVVLEQALFTLSEDLYNHYKDQAASICLEKTYKFKLEEMKNRAYLTTEKRRFETILSQRHVQLLGRSVNMRFLLGQLVTTKLSLDVDMAIKKFEASDVCCLAELHAMLQVVQQTHNELSSPGMAGGGPLLELDSFLDIFNEVNGTYSPAVLKGRISAQFFYALTQDLFGNFAYNSFTQRFVRSPKTIIEFDLPPVKKTFVDAVFGPMCHKALKNACELQKGFFGRAHLESYLALPGSGPQDVPVLVNECLRFLEFRIQALSYAIEALSQPDGLESFSLDKTASHTSVLAFAFFEARLGGLLQSFDDLKLEVFQMFREVGNCVAFLRDLGECLDVRDQFHFVAVAPFLGLAPDSPAADGGVGGTPLVATLQAYRVLLEKSKDEHQIIVNRATVGTMADLAKGTAEMAGHTFAHRGLFHAVLQGIDDILYKFDLRSRWALCNPKHGHPALLLAPSGNAKLRPARFVHVWSSLCFLFNMQNQEPDPEAAPQEREWFAEYTDLEMFGHGMSFAGCLFTHLLDQRAVYELTDYSYEVLRLRNLEEALPKDRQQRAFSGVSPQDMDTVNEFIDGVQAQRDLHASLFALYAAHWTAGVSKAHTYQAPAVFAD